MSRSLTLQFVVVELLEVFKVFPKDKVRRSGLRSRSLTFQFQVVGVMDFLPIFIWQLSRWFCQESRNKFFFFSHFSPNSKSAPAATLPSATVHGHSSSSELSAHQIPRAGNPRDTLENFKNKAGMWMRNRTLVLALLRPGRLLRRAWLRSTWSATGAAAGLRGGVVLASVVLFLVRPLMDAADGGGD